MANTTSLLKSAGNIRGQLSAYDDKVAAYTFQNSARTDSDLQAYRDHLMKRIDTLESSGSITNISSALTLRQTLTSAINSTASANIQRSTIAVLDGQGTADDKLAAIGNAFQQLYSIGDLNAAQSYESQYYSYYQTVQLQKAEAAKALSSASGGGSGGSSGYSSLVTAAESSIKQNISDANAAFAAQGPKFLDQQTNAYLKQQSAATGVKANGSATVFAALAGQVGMVNKGIQLNGDTKYAQGTYTPGSMMDIYTQAIALDPSHADSYQSKIDGYLNGATSVALPGEGSKSITYNALMNTVYAGNSGNAPYSITKGADGSWQVAAEHISAYTFGKDMNGNMKLMPSYSFFTAPIDNKTKDVLTKAGVNVKQDGNGDWWFQATNQSSFLGKVLGNYPTQGAVQKDGKVQFMGENGQLYQMVHDAKGLVGVQQVNQFGQIINNNVSGQYGFTPTATANTVKGSTAFMTKTLGESATPQDVNGQTIYNANGKLYRLVSDAKGLKGLQEIDKTGKVVNDNISGQYGFDPKSINRLTNKNSAGLADGNQFTQTLLAQHQQYMNQLAGAKSTGFQGAHNPDGISLASAPWLGVSNLLDNARIMQTINSAHDQAMIALAPPLALPSISLPSPGAPNPAPAQQAPAPLQAAPTFIQAPTRGTQTLQPAAGNFQGGVGAGINQSAGKGVTITGVTNGPVGMRI